jgi:mono/diheme cytochrome c family protein
MVLGAIWSCLHAPLSAQEIPPTEEQRNRAGEDFFETSIRPILIERCYACHSIESGEAEGGLLLDSRQAMERGGVHGTLKVASPAESRLLRAVQYGDSALQMPPDGKLPDEAIAAIAKWVELGMPDPREESAEAYAARPRTRADRAKEHWAYLPPAALPVSPPPTASGMMEQPIDGDWIGQLASRGLTASHPASPATLIRRLSFDLLGLPPSPEELEAFVADPAEDAYLRLVDRYLQSPHFGERMARRWMDVVRYADTKGYVFTEDRAYPHAYRYRDWLIRSFRQDLPYDQFVRYQLAADRLDPENQQGHLDAMGMLTLGRRFLNNPNDIADDRIDVVTRGLLATTVGCARCHDHKFDPVSMAEYYSLHGVFTNSEEPGGDPSPMRLVDRAEQRPSYIFLRGQQGQHGETIQRRFIAVLSKGEPRPLDQGSGRIDLAEAIVDPANPLTRRVLVNRIWGWLIGSPLVDTPSDFGLRCDPPIQQSLLDRLASELQWHGDSIQWLVRTIVTSAAYRQTSDWREDAAGIDPENRLIWRANRRRLDFEAFRDSMLDACNQLDRTIGGPSQVIHSEPFSNRRTLYASIDRQNLPGLFRTFDFANPDTHVPQRAATTVPQQGLFVLNSPMVIQLAKSMGERLAARWPLETVLPQGDAAPQAGDQPIQEVFRWVLRRPATGEEVDQARQFLAIPGGTDAKRWGLLVQGLLATNEFSFID